MNARVCLASAVLAGMISAWAGDATAQTMGTITVTNETPGIARPGEVARGGISFAQGNAPADPNHIHFKLNGAEIAAQVHQLGRGHTDGTIRHALVQLPVSLSATSTPQQIDFYIDPNNARPAAANVVTVTTTGPSTSPTSVTVVNSGLEVRLDAACFHLPNVLKLNGQTLVNNTSVCSGASTVDPSDDLLVRGRIETTVAGVTVDGFGRATEPGATGVGALAPSAASPAQDFSAQLRGPVELTVEESGPLRAVVRVRQPSTVRTQNGRFGFLARLYFEAGRPAFRVSYTLTYQAEPMYLATNCSSPSFLPVPVAHIEELTYRLGPTGVTSTALAVRPDSMPTATVNVNAMPAPGTGWNAVNLPGQAPDLDAGWASLQGSSWRMVLANRAFEGVGPKRVQIVSNRIENQLLLRPSTSTTEQQVRTERQLALHGGHSRTWEFLIDLSSPVSEPVINAGKRARAIASRNLVATHLPCDAAAREPWFRFASEATGPSCSPTRAALPSLAAYHANTRAYENGTAPSNPSFGRVFGWFAGDRDFGANTSSSSTYPTIETSQGGQYGPADAVLMRYRASGNLQDLRKGEDMIRFALNTSLVSWATAGTACHQRNYVPAGREPLTHATNMHSGELVMGNNYLAYNDVVNYYFLTGDRRVVDILRELPRWPGVALGNEMPVAGQFGREFYAPFAAFLDAWEVLGDNRQMCAVLGAGCTATEPPNRPLEFELSASDATLLFKAIKAMRDLASGIPVSTRPNGGPAMLDASALTARVPDRMAPDGQNPEYDLLGSSLPPPHCVSGLRSRTSTISDKCIPMNTPGLVGTDAAGSAPDLTPFFISFGTRALARYHALTGDSVTRDALEATVRIQHLFRNPFGLFQAKALAPLHDRFTAQEDFVAASAAYLAIASGPSSSEASQRLNEAAPSVEYRLTFRRKYNSVQRFGLDADLYPFLAVWVDRGYSETSLRTTAQNTIWQTIRDYDLAHPAYRVPTTGDPSVHLNDTELVTFDSNPTPNPLSIFWDVYFRTPQAERLNGPRGIALAELFGSAMYARGRLALTASELSVFTVNQRLDNCPHHHTPSSPAQLLGMTTDAGVPWSIPTTQGPHAATSVRTAVMLYSASRLPLDPSSPCAANGAYPGYPYLF